MAVETQLCERGLFFVSAMVFLGFSSVYLREFCKRELATTYSRLSAGSVTGFPDPAVAVCIPYDGVYFDLKAKAEAGVYKLGLIPHPSWP